MNSRVRGITAFRTIYFVPSVISGAALSLLWLMIYNNDYGMLNVSLRAMFTRPGVVLLTIGCVIAAIGGAILVTRAFGDRGLSAPIIVTLSIGGLLIVIGAVLWVMGAQLPLRPPNWFGVDTTVDPPVNDAARWAVPAFVIMNLWGVGSGMIIYLAGLKGVPQSYYEAATIDGAGPIRKLWNVTLPMLSPLIFFQVVMGIIGSFQIFTQAYFMSTGTNSGEGSGPENATLFYVVNLYQLAFQLHQMGYASAMAWILFLIVLGLTIFVFRASRSVVYYEGLKA
jgi:ABC-type sugar transport system permease subunit